MTEPADSGNRRRALDPRISFSVRAPAGSGKTELLTQRVLVLLANVQRPEEILAITFTRKAAAEMRDRLLKALQLAQQADAPESDYQRQTWQLARAALANDQAQGWQLLENPSRLQIMTIDSFCASITKQLPMQSHFGLQPEIAPDATALYQQAVNRLLVELEQESAVADALATLLLHLDNAIDRVEQLLISMLSRRDQWLPLIGSGDQIRQARPLLESALAQLNRDELSQLHQRLLPFSGPLLESIDYAASNLVVDGKPSPLTTLAGITELPGIESDQLPRWQAITELLLKKDGDWRKTLTVANGFPAGKTKPEKEQAKARKEALLSLIVELAELPELKDRLQRLQLLPEGHYQERQWHILDALTRVLPNLVAQLWLSFAEHGQVDYSQITAAALQALGDEEAPTDLSLLLDYRLSHILIDEFQDTASPQIQLLRKLTAGWQTGDGRTLFIVGDGMQSCYGFRDANVGLFLDARKHGIGDVRLSDADLSVNFRSQQGVVDWVNQTFVSAFPAQDDISRGAVSYSDSIAFNAPLPGNAVELHGLVDFPDRPSQAEAEAAKVAELVLQAQREDPKGSVAVLVRNRPHLKAILPALRRAGLSWQATDLDPLATRIWVSDLVSLTRALSNPADRIAWLAIVRAPWCGLDNADLLALAGGEHQQTPIWKRICQQLEQPQLSPDGLARLQRLHRVIAPCWQQRLRRSLRDNIELCWLKLGGAAGLDQAQLLDIERVLQLLQQFDQGGQLRDWAGFERALGQLYAQPAANADSRLQIMTIHKSKGLEFDTVILAGLDRRPPAPDKPLLQWQLRLDSQGHEELLLAPLAARDQADEPIYRYLSVEQQERDRMEMTRLLYVGTTRAVKRLHLTANLKTDKNGELATPGKDSLLARIWPQVKEQFQLQYAPASLQQKAPSPRLGCIERTPLEWLPQLPSEPALLPSPRQLASEGDNLPEPDWLQSARLAGTLAHNLFKRLAEGDQLPTPEQLERELPAWQLQLQQLGLAHEQLEQAAHRVLRLVSNCLGDERGRWILDNRHSDSSCELPISFDNGFQVQHYIVDRSFIDEDGNRWIIDYKTASCPDELGFDAFVSAEVERYRPQLNNYARAFAALESRPIRTALYFPESRHFEELSCSYGNQNGAMQLDMLKP